MALDASGLTIRTYEEILKDINDEQKGTIDPNLVTEPEEPQGQMNGIFSTRVRELWEILQTIVNMINPNAAEGILLDNTSALSGSVRDAAKASTVVCTMNLDAATTVPAGSEIYLLGDPTTIFVLDEDTTSVGAGDYNADYSSKELGPIVANSGTLTEIGTPVVGWNSVTNPLDATLGNIVESDTSLRLKRENQLQKAGGATIGGIGAEIAGVTGVQTVQKYENTTNLVDSNNIPPHATEFVVWDGSGQDADDDELAQAVWDSKAGGVQSYGSTSATATDSDGVEHTMWFTRATSTNIYITFDLTVDSAEYAGDSVFAAAIVVAAEEEQLPNVDVIVSFYIKVAMQQPGVVDTTSVKVGLSPAPAGSANLSMGIRQRADFDTSRVVVNS
jgi:uncharacterized phage protein gp47/JayE